MYLSLCHSFIHSVSLSLFFFLTLSLFFYLSLPFKCLCLCLKFFFLSSFLLHIHKHFLIIWFIIRNKWWNASQNLSELSVSLFLCLPVLMSLCHSFIMSLCQAGPLFLSVASFVSVSDFKTLWFSDPLQLTCIRGDRVVPVPCIKWR